MTLDASHFPLYLIRDFLEIEMCREVTKTLAASPSNAATVYGLGQSGSIAETTRRTSRVIPPPEIVEAMEDRLAARQQEISAHYSIALEGHEEPQFLRYRTGDFFVAHQDGNTGLMQSKTEQWRKISVVIFLNQHSENVKDGTYGGGDLVFSEWRRRPHGQFHFHGEPGTLIAFPSETTHEVIPVTHGERYSIASWYGRS
ncbi:MAG TPA: 2OG-Fe(II) oxygenase [Pyrinomonadaceae bacterium]